jgi:hypothetical protein
LTVLFAIGVAAVAQESGATQPKTKKPTRTPEAATQTAPSTQTQTAPSAGKSADAKGNAAKDPKQAGWTTVHGRIMVVQAEQKAVIIQTDVKQYQIHVTAQTQITRDGKPADLKALRPNDRVDGCHFNAKHVAQTLKVTSAENVLARPNPSNQ